MADNDWGDLDAQFVTKLREQRIEDVPEQIVKLAQMSLDGAPHPTARDKDNKPVVMHAMQRPFETEARAAAFARHMRNAGLHTKPQSSITVTIDPERKRVQQVIDGVPQLNDKGKPVMVPGPAVDPKLVAWRAGARRGRTGS